MSQESPTSNMSPKDISDVQELFRKVYSGELKAVIEGAGWDETFAGDVKWNVSDGSWFSVFNDCYSLDYISEVHLSDGREFDYEQLYYADKDIETSRNLGLEPPSKEIALKTLAIPPESW